MEARGWDESAEAWIEHVDQGDDLRESTLDPVMIEWVREIDPAVVLDIGCGEGRFCRMLQKRGISTLGLEITGGLVHRSKSRDKSGRYLRASALQLPIHPLTIDLISTYIVLIDIENHEVAVTEGVRALRSGGFWLDAHIIPFRTSSSEPWVKSSAGKRLHVPIENYSQARPQRAAWKDIDVVNYHRPLHQYWKPFLDAGLILRKFVEPTPSPGQARHDGDERVPLGMISLWEKP